MLLASGLNAEQQLSECLDHDSISCLQLSVGSFVTFLV